MNGWDSWEPWLDEGFAKYLTENVDVFDFLDHFKIDYTKIFSSNYSAKLRCPIPEHLGGNEKTASMFVTQDNGRMSCFGCNFSGSIIDLYMAIENKCLYDALKDLYFIFLDGQNIEITQTEKVDPRHRMAPWVFECGVMIRDFIASKKNKVRWESWADKRFKQLDKYLDMPDEQWEKVRRYKGKLKKFIKEQGGHGT